MARDHAPWERQRQQLERKQGRRASYDRILIVCEGSKTEPLYFNEIRIAYRLHSAHVQVRPSELGTSPLQVVQYAQSLFQDGDRHKGIRPRAFDQIFAVFDRDAHDTYLEALKEAEKLNRKLRNDERQVVQFHAVASVPSFELWLLLHFEEIHAPLRRDEVMQRLKRHLPAYAKGSRETFEITRQRQAEAIQRAQRLATRFTAYTEPEPYTGIVDLVKRLITLRTTP